MAAPLDRQLHTPVGDAPVIPVAMIVLGGYLCWFAIHYWASDTAWPSDPVKALLTGKGLPKPDKTALPQAIAGLQQNATSGQLAKGPSENVAGGTAIGAGGTMTHADLVNLWQANGGSVGTADIGAAIALAESSGRVTVTSSNPDGGTNVGLWQLDTKGAGAGYTVDQLQDAPTNARVTVMKSSNGTNWSAWETWHTGAYRQYLTTLQG